MLTGQSVKAVPRKIAANRPGLKVVWCFHPLWPSYHYLAIHSLANTVYNPFNWFKLVSTTNDYCTRLENFREVFYGVKGDLYILKDRKT